MHPAAELGLAREHLPNRPEARSIRLPALPRLRRRRYASCRGEKKQGSIAFAGCTHSSARALISASSLPVNALQHPRHRYFAVLQAARHASTKTTSTALVHPCTLSSAHTGEHRKTTEYRKTTVDAPPCRNPRPTKSKSVGLRAQARQGLRRRPPQRHGHGPGWENCGARCGRSQG